MPNPIQVNIKMNLSKNNFQGTIPNFGIMTPTKNVSVFVVFVRVIWRIFHV
jgi:hypothetical protein